MESSYDISVIGAGAMGRGIATHCAMHGAAVSLVDHKQQNLVDADNQITEILELLGETDTTHIDSDAVRDRIHLTLNRVDAARASDLVLETVSEDVETKQQLFAELAAETTPDTILASNTSSIQIDTIANGAPDAAERIAGCHWWYPPYLLTPVEIVRGTKTTDRVIDALEEFVMDMEQDPILVQKDAPGFVWNRVQFAVVRECLHIVEEGIASIEDVNTAIRDGYATRTAAIGPFETIDIAGLPLFDTIAADLFPELSNANTPHDELRDRVTNGQTGVDAGAGFFEYDEPLTAVTARRDKKIAAIWATLERLD